MSLFYGRKKELSQLEGLLKKEASSLVTVTGRRRIGKSTLIEYFGEKHGKFVSIQGLGPDISTKIADQLRNFSQSVSQQLETRQKVYENWTEAFIDLAEKTKKGRYIILLDEISWMAKGDPLFPVYLKNAWDQYFKKNPKLILILCGSVSAWIEKNILQTSTFLGRVSLSLNVEELALHEINRFWERKKFKLNTFEKMMILSITGGVPKYLEELSTQSLGDIDLAKICFDPSGLLFREFESIFTDIFSRKSKTLSRMIRTCAFQKLTPTELAQKMKMDFNSEFSEYIHILEISGFLARDYSYKFDGKASKLSHLRVRDNYLRFYLKYIEPLKEKVRTSQKQIKYLSDLPQFESMMGYQFENLILAQRNRIIEKLELKEAHIQSASPYVQRVTSKVAQACQIDLLIQTSLGIFFLCEIKCQKKIDRSVIDQVEKKIRALKRPRHTSVRPVLIYVGQLYEPHQEELYQYFHQIISMDNLMIKES